MKGGCGFYISDSIKFKPRKDLDIKECNDTHEIESKWMEVISYKQPNYLIDVIYRHPKRSDMESILSITSTLNKVKNENKNILICGDFNYNLLNLETDEMARNFINLMYENFFQPCILRPTRVLSYCKPSLGDNIFINNTNQPISGNIIDKISDHMPNFLILENVANRNNKSSCRKRDMRKFDAKKIEEDVNNIDLVENINNSNDVNSIYNAFQQKFIEIINRHAPIKKLSKKQIKTMKKPWLTKGILKSIGEKNKTYKKFVNTKNKTLYNKYKVYRDLLNTLIRKSKKKHYMDYFEAFAHNSKKTWDGINEILGKNVKTKHNDIHLNEKGQLITKPKDVADKFNNFFLNIAGVLCKSLPQCNTEFQDPNQNSFFMSETTPFEIEKLIDDLDCKKSSDIHGISPNFIKIGKFRLASILSYIFNCSIIQGKFPDALKVAKILPLHKSDSKYEISNYRPISILPIFSKLLEKLVYSRLFNFICKHNILYENQFGFQKNKSTELAITALINNIIKSYEIRQSACCIFLDFAKAFDIVNHSILISKLEHYGIRGIALDWFKSYLFNREQCTEINNTLSNKGFIKCGVPQGSVLGPLLFLLYINDITATSKILKFYLFADDTSIFYSDKKDPETVNLLNLELKKVSDWLTANKLSLNIGKSCYLNFSLSSLNNNYTNIIINGENLKEKSTTKYLGVLIDNKLKWKDHITHVTNKLSKGIGLLAKLRHFVPKAALRNLYFSFIQPFIDYCSLNWAGTPTTNLDNLRTKIKKAVRVISFKKQTDHSLPLFQQLKILPLDQEIKLKQGKFMWKLENNLIPHCIENNFTINKASMISRNSSKKKICLPLVRLDYSKRFITYSGVNLWNNEIPFTIKNAPSLGTFCKDFLLHSIE